jgi:peptide/nickel transport system substrate-binding protein
LQGGQVDAYAQATLSLAKSLGTGSGLRAITSLPGQWTPLTMRVDQAPFNDPRVRQAFRLMVDRKQYIDVSLSGYGDVANDVFSQWDPAFVASLHRDQDVEQARSLLKQAGQESLGVELTTADIAPGVLAGAEAFAQQAKQAGVDVRINKVPTGTLFGPNYLQWTFAQDYWADSPYLSQVAQGMLPRSPFNETHWDDPQYADLYELANRTTDAAKQKQLIQGMMQMDHQSGGYIIPSYNKQIDLVSSQVHGIEPAGTGIPMGNADWSRIWLAAS